MVSPPCHLPSPSTSIPLFPGKQNYIRGFLTMQYIYDCCVFGNKNHFSLEMNFRSVHHFFFSTACKPKPTKPKKPQEHEAFLFPSKTTTDYLDAGTLNKNLDALTACLWLKTTDKTPEVGYISYATDDHHNAFLLFRRINAFELYSYAPR